MVVNPAEQEKSNVDLHSEGSFRLRSLMRCSQRCQVFIARSSAVTTSRTKNLRLLWKSVIVITGRMVNLGRTVDLLPLISIRRASKPSAPADRVLYNRGENECDSCFRTAEDESTLGVAAGGIKNLLFMRLLVTGLSTRQLLPERTCDSVYHGFNGRSILMPYIQRIEWRRKSRSGDEEQAMD
nr:hypothetical protein CFP56_52759 [Quercus suber]